VTAAVFKRQARIVAFIASVLLNLMVTPAFAACSTPAGNEGDINYVSSLHVMVYCNGTSWIGMGVSNPVSFGTLTNGDFCLATSGTAISCTTQFVNMTSQVTGTLGTTNGGTGLAAYTTGDMLYASATNTLSKLSIGTTGWVLTASPSGPTWTASVSNSVGSFSAGTTGFTPSSAATGAVTLAGTLNVGNGGTGTATALTKGSVVIAGTSGVYTQDNANFFYDATNHRLGIGTATPTQGLTVFGNIDATSSGYLTEISNGSVATVLNSLAKLDTSGKATNALTTDVDGVIGIVVGNPGTSGSAQIATDGQANCAFDGATTAGHFVTISSTTAGDCKDAGATRSVTNQTIGRVLSTNGAAGIYAVALGLNGASNGGVPNGTIAAFAGTCPSGWTEYTAARGRFLRGIDNGAGNDPDGTRAAGATQADMVGSHTHTINVANQAQNTSNNFAAGGINNPASTLTTSASGGAETRPKNVAVTFCQYTGGSPVTTTASGTANYVARWTSATTIGTGTMYDSGSAVGLNTASPQNLLDVNGAASIGYNVAAPTNGLIVSGNVGIGTPAPNASLEVWTLRDGAPSLSSSANATVEFASTVTTALDIGNDSASPFEVWMQTKRFTNDGTSWPLSLNPLGGNVGIGTTNPQNPLVVRTGTNQNFAVTSPISMANGIGLTAYNDAINANVDMEFHASAFDFSEGNVGIGTASPVTPLHVRTAANANFYVYNGIDVNSGTGNVDLESRDDTNATFEPMVFKGSVYYFLNSGNVGIGTTGPFTPLTVAAPSTGTGEALSIQQGSDGASVVLCPGASLTNCAYFTQRANNTVNFTGPVSFEVDRYGGSTPLFFINTASGGSGNVGIGTTSPSFTLDTNGIIASEASGIANTFVTLGLNPSASGSPTTYGGMYFDSSKNLHIEALSGGVAWRNIVLQGQGNGNVGIGTNSPNDNLEIDGAGNGGGGPIRARNTGNAAGKYWEFGPDNSNSFRAFNQSTVGVYVGDGATTWSAFSDERLKTNIKALPASDGLEAILKLNPVTFNWKSITSPRETQTGFIAQEVQKVLPDLVSHAPDTKLTLADGKTEDVKDVEGLNYTGFVVPLVKAVQELKADNDNLRAANDNETAQIKILAARLDALEIGRH
jgi:hypothetical protein